MGIHGLSTLIQDQCPETVKENEPKNYFGRKIAIDCSMALYQFLIAMQHGTIGFTDESGETTSHLIGLFHRSIGLLTKGIKPVYVFDGKPPEMKSGELLKRKERNQEAQESLAKAKEEGRTEDVEKFAKRTIRVTRQHNDEAKELLRLMGIPFVEAPCEAEAQCAALNKAGKVYATATEDMDSLTFGTPILLRNMTYSEAQKKPVKEYRIDQVLEGMQLTQAQFIDMCILCGCDYTSSIRGIGPVTALKLIRKHGSLEEILKNIDTSKYQVPDPFPYEQVRDLFVNPEVTDPEEIKLSWRDPDEEGLMKFLVDEKNFSADRVRSGIEKIKKCKTSSVQNRLTSYFGQPTVVPNKRKAEEVAKNKNAKKKGPRRK
eukprot:GCRY01003437.1.p1 GENE.GCRY01003437.1~~GCRY01003437.1.p1  ORF type:complete len:374 (-),score=109.09 GCRY01003437.1:219-1340(-)